MGYAIIFLILATAARVELERLVKTKSRLRELELPPVELYQGGAWVPRWWKLADRALLAIQLLLIAFAGYLVFSEVQLLIERAWSVR